MKQLLFSTFTIPGHIKIIPVVNPIKKNKGSAIFLHIAKNNYKKTKGCIAVSKRDMRKILNQINKKTKIII